MFPEYFHIKTFALNSMSHISQMSDPRQDNDDDSTFPSYLNTPLNKYEKVD